jgi:hypothetical protein
MPFTTHLTLVDHLTLFDCDESCEMIWLKSLANSPPNRTTDWPRSRPGFVVRLLASLLLVRLGASAVRWAVRQALTRSGKVIQTKIASKRNIIMQTQLLASLVFTALFATSTLAKDRPITDDERTKLAAAIAEQGCSGGKMEFDTDDNEFEVGDAKCNDGHKYDLTFDSSFKLIKKEMED